MTLGRYRVSACSGHADGNHANIKPADGSFELRPPISENTSPLGSMMNAALELGAATTIPALFFALNWKIRRMGGYAMSAATDFALAIASFDLAMLVAYKILAPIVPDPFLQSHFVIIIVILFCITGLVWSTILLPIENKVASRFNYVESSYENGAPILLFLISWTITLMIFTMHILIFIWGSVA